jgi:hypothetical protein
MIWSRTEWHNLLFGSETRTWEDGMRARSGSLCIAARKFWRSPVLAAMAAVLLLVGGAALAQGQTPADPNAPALRLINIIPINGTAGSPATGLHSFDISWVDPTTGLYFLADRSNAALDVVDTKTDTLFGQIGGAAIGFAGDTGTTATSGPNGVAVAPTIPCIFATDTASTGGGRVVAINYNVSFVTLAGLVNTGGNRRADELAFDPVDNLLLVINNAEVSPSTPFGTLIRVSPTCGLTIATQFTFTSIHATNGAEQPVWDPTTRKFYLSIPEVNGPGGGGPTGGVLRIGTTGVFENFYTINFCQPAGLTIGPNDDLLVGCNTVFDTSGNACTAVVPAPNPAGTPAAHPATCTGTAHPQAAICNPAAGRNCTGNALVSVPGAGGGDEVWFNRGDGNYYVTAGNNPLGPSIGVVASVVNTLTQLVPTLPPVPLVPLVPPVGTRTTLFSSGTVHSIAASAANNHVYVALPLNTAYPNCAQGCIAVFSAQ